MSGGRGAEPASAFVRRVPHQTDGAQQTVAGGARRVSDGTAGDVVGGVHRAGEPPPTPLHSDVVRTRPDGAADVRMLRGSAQQKNIPRIEKSIIYGGDRILYIYTHNIVISVKT